MNLRLSVDALRVFRAVVQTGSMSQAASLLHLSQSAVSWKIKRLEQQLDCQLLARSGGLFGTTDQGAVLLRHAVNILDAHDDAVAHFSPSAMHGRLRIGVTEQISLTDVCAVLSQFSHHHPKVDVQLVVEQSQVLRERFADGVFDVILHQDFAGMAAPADTLLWTETLHWCAATAEQTLPGETVKLITYGPHCFYRRLAEEKLGQAGMAWSVGLECPSVAGVLTAIAAGLGMAVVNERNLGQGVHRHAALERLAPLPRVASLLRANDNLPDPVRDGFCQLLLAALQNRRNDGSRR
ncbi:LysR family transcriptional regulator [Janthinobacterium sp. BJB301]|uniref:LysR family transcriptional regulator n=1 Tax=Janthinobacterium sp. BJB301 TaxID=1560195 RepID=UPI000C0F5533|nr:LysR family transcriptional regulator [Janthinobacterium sp. BJB301]PHV50086.1 LysR family transcriptional regulator [Janthinobacterium sp. BJB301]